MEKTELLEKLLQTNLLTLAFIGDSVHTLFVREHCLEEVNLKLENYNNKASRFCKASSQAAALEAIMPSLTEEECEIVRRARNAKSKHHAKNASTDDYSHATAFEALIGFLYLKNYNDRLEEILTFSINYNRKLNNN